MPSHTLFRSTSRLLALAVGLLLPLAGNAADFDNSSDFDYTTVSAGQELGCLAMNIYHEGRGESPRGRAAIAAVTMNRVRSKHFPNTICEVVWQRKQFSWTQVATRHHVIKDSKAWQQSLVLADLFINGAELAEIGHATHYHAVSVKPSWMEESRLIALVGRHFFYAL